MFIVFRMLAVHGANALGCPLTVGYPTLTAFHGYACAALRRLAQELETEVRPTGLTVVHHIGQLRAHGNYRNRLTQKRYVHDNHPPPEAERQTYYFSPSGKPMPEVDLTVSMLVQVATPFPLGPALTRMSRDAVHVVVGPKAFGGTVQSHGGLVAAPTLPDALCLLPASHLLIDRSDELMHPDKDPLDRMLDLLQTDYEPHRYFAPLQIGWRGLAPLTERETPRGHAAHTFAEPLIGLIEFLRTSAVTADMLPKTLWRARIDRDCNFFLLETTSHGPDAAA